MTLEVLSVVDCPHHAAAVRALEQALATMGLRCPVRETRVADESSARAHRLQGSPTVRVNGRAVGGAVARELAGETYACRLAAPTATDLESALRTALAAEGVSA